MLRASLTEAAVSFTHIELVAQGAVDDIDKVGGETGEGGADNCWEGPVKVVVLAMWVQQTQPRFPHG
jgi:hypothetical protein